MDRSAKLEVAAKTDGQPRKPVLFAPDREKVRQSLGGMAVSAVACVDHRDGGVGRRNVGSALLGVAHRNDISIARYGLGRVRNALALCGRGSARARNGDDMSAQLIHCGLKAHTGAGRWLKKQRRKLLAVAGVGVLVRICNDVLRRGNELFKLLRAQIQNVDHRALHLAPPIQLSSEGLSRKALRRLTSSGLM